MKQLALFNDPEAPTVWADDLAEAVAGRDQFALYSKQRERKDAFIRSIQEQHPGPLVILCPRPMAAHHRARFAQAIVVALEDLTAKKDTFLRLHAVVSRDTTLVLEGVARYTVLSSDKFNYLHRLRMATRRRYLVDSVPFTKAIPKLYLPWSYLDRDILQYSNGWSFEYNYLEEDAQGRFRRAHDDDFLAEKLAPWCHLDYPSFLPPMTVVETAMTDEEHRGYAACKAALFEQHDNPHKIVTDLCDYANRVASRADGIAPVVRQHRHTIIYTNIVANVQPLKRRLRRHGLAGFEIRTYMKHNYQPVEADAVILFETPLNQNQVSAIDVLADIRPDTPTYHVRNDSRADQHIVGEVWPEWQAIDHLIRALWQEQERGSHGAARLSS